MLAKVDEIMRHFASVLVEIIPASMFFVVVEMGFAVRHFAGDHVVVHPFTIVGGYVFNSLGHGTCLFVKVVPAAIAVIFSFD